MNNGQNCGFWEAVGSVWWVHSFLHRQKFDSLMSWISKTGYVCFLFSQWWRGGLWGQRRTLATMVIMYWVLLCARLTPNAFCALPPFILTMTFQGQKGWSDGDITLETQHDTPFLSAGLVNSKTFQFITRGLCNFSPQQRALPFMSSFVDCADVNFHFSFELSIIATSPLSSLVPCPFTLASCVFCMSSTDLFLIFSHALLAYHAAMMFQVLHPVQTALRILSYRLLVLCGEQHCLHFAGGETEA